MNDDIRHQIKTACYLFGNQKTVAIGAGVDNSNFGKWLKGANTLSEEKLHRVLGYMKLPDFKPRTDEVHLWEYTDPPAPLIDLDMVPALKLFFPDGGKIAKAPWATKGLQSLKRKVISPWKQPRAVYAITDGHVRAILRMMPHALIHKGNIKSHLQWRNGTEEASLLDITDDENWLDGTPKIEEFDAVWNAPRDEHTPADLIRAVRVEGITIGEAISRIRNPK